MGMVDVGEKPVVERRAEAAGEIRLSRETIEAVLSGQIPKGDPLGIAEVAGMIAAKQTHLLVPHCHPIALDTVSLGFTVSPEHIEARCVVKARARTGVEMEALVGVTMALNTLWDVLKSREKDAQGQYPHTRIDHIRVLSKTKGPIEEV